MQERKSNIKDFIGIYDGYIPDEACDEAIELADGIKEIRRMHSSHKNMTNETNPSSIPTSNKDNDGIITLIFLDATWKYAKEMHKKTSLRNAWPQNMLQVKLSPTSNSRYKPNRFNIRATPSLDQMSTAECIAFVVSVIEDREELYDTLMKPLDCMVNIWNSYEKGKSTKNEFMVDM